MGTFPKGVRSEEQQFLLDTLQLLPIDEIFKYTGPLNFFKVQWNINQWMKMGHLMGAYRTFSHKGQVLYIIKVDNERVEDGRKRQQKR